MPSPARPPQPLSPKATLLTHTVRGLSFHAQDEEQLPRDAGGGARQASEGSWRGLPGLAAGTASAAAAAAAAASAAAAAAATAASAAYTGLGGTPGTAGGSGWMALPQVSSPDEENSLPAAGAAGGRLQQAFAAARPALACLWHALRRAGGLAWSAASAARGVLQVAAGHGGDLDHPEAINPFYYVLYVFSSVAFFVGTLLYIFPSLSILRRLVGVLLFACGVFLMMNSDLVVTFVRLHLQVSQFRANQDRLAELVEDQSVELRRLHKAEHGFRELDKRFDGDARQAAKEVSRLEDICRSDIGRIAKKLCRLYCDTDEDQIISFGAEMDYSFELMATVFGGAVKDFPQRVEALKEALISKAVVRRDGGINRRTYQEIMECAMLEDDPKRIPKAVRKLLDESARKAGGG